MLGTYQGTLNLRVQGRDGCIHISRLCTESSSIWQVLYTTHTVKLSYSELCHPKIHVSGTPMWPCLKNFVKWLQLMLRPKGQVPTQHPCVLVIWPTGELTLWSQKLKVIRAFRNRMAANKWDQSSHWKSNCYKSKIQGQKLSIKVTRRLKFCKTVMK